MKQSKTMNTGCNRCGNAYELTEASSDATTPGEEFVEHYECPHCDARGTVKGVVGQPVKRWRKSGGVFGL